MIDVVENLGSSDDVDATVNFYPTANFDPTAKINVYPDETANESILQTASFVEEHLKSLCKYTQLFSVYKKRVC